MAGKTPISRLQELSSKRKLSAPEYELIFNRPEGLDPKFTYKCTFDGFVSQGSGRTKRDAKHESAGQLLTMLPLLESEGADAESTETQNLVTDPVVQPHCNKINTNFVGELAFYCMEILNAPEKPIYEEAGSVGSSHNPTFTIKCTVSSYTTTADGPTKKQAKHLASKYMLEKLEQLDKTHADIPESTTVHLLDMPQMTDTEKRVIERVLVLQMPPHSSLENEMTEKFNQLNLNAPAGLLTYPENSKSDNWNSYECLQQICNCLGEGMLSFYNFRKMLLDDPSPHLGFCDPNSTPDQSEKCSDDVVFSCSVTVHLNPLNLHCKGLGSTVEESISYGASRMLQLLFMHFYDRSPFSG